MTVKNDIVLWDNGTDKFCLFSIPNEAQYKYIDNIPCITFGISYENLRFKGYETFTLFDKFYTDTIEKMGTVHHSLNGAFRICDVGADTDGYIDFEMNNGKLLVKGQLGATFSSHSLQFEFEADQTLLTTLLKGIKI